MRATLKHIAGKFQRFVAIRSLSANMNVLTMTHSQGHNFKDRRGINIVDPDLNIQGCECTNKKSGRTCMLACRISDIHIGFTKLLRCIKG